MPLFLKKAWKPFSFLFTRHSLPRNLAEAFAAVLAKKRNELVYKGEESSLEDILSLVSVQEKQALRPLKTQDLAKADFQKTETIFSFSLFKPARLCLCNCREYRC